jgi:hypothetical protein
MQPQVTEFRRTALAALVERVAAATPVVDIHTHLYDPAFGGLSLWGIDELLVYHYLVAEAFRHAPISYDEFWALSKSQQADLIWQWLFVEHTPISEACRGVLTTLHRLGLDVKERDLPAIRQMFASLPPEEHMTRCLAVANVQKVYMSNSPFDEAERTVWEGELFRDERFLAALRADPLLVDWPHAVTRLIQWGYDVGEGLSSRTCSEVRRFLADWTRKMQAHYVMVSVPPDFAYPGPTESAQFLEEIILPHCREFGLPFALMLGVRRAVNPGLRLAGDSVGRSELAALSNLCAAYPQHKFMATVLARENQHELAVLARKFPNLHVFGCWWFTNIPSLVEEITRLRLELLGPSFTAQHSDARVLEQLIYKWDHFRRIVAKVLIDKYADVAQAGWEPTAAEVERDVRNLFGGAFEAFLAR